VKLDETLEMAYPRPVAREILIDAAEPINQHLVKLVGFPFPEELRQHFRKELRSGLNRIQRLRLKPDTRTGSVKFYFNPIRVPVRRDRGAEHARPDGVNFQRIRRRSAEPVARRHRGLAAPIPHPAGRSPAQWRDRSRPAAGAVSASPIATSGAVVTHAAQTDGRQIVMKLSSFARTSRAISGGTAAPA
jgi:hypothetical protein